MQASDSTDRPGDHIEVKFDKEFWQKVNSKLFTVNIVSWSLFIIYLFFCCDSF